jgi:hypothetical protein
MLARYELQDELSFGEAPSRGAWGRLKQSEGGRELEEHPARVPENAGYDPNGALKRKVAVHLFTRV